MQKRLWIMLSILIGLIASGCGMSSTEQNQIASIEETHHAAVGAQTEANAAEETEAKPALEISTDPVTLKLYVHVVRLSEIEYDNFFVKPLSKYYPHITLQKIEGELDQLTAAGEIPDISSLTTIGTCH